MITSDSSPIEDENLKLLTGREDIYISHSVLKGCLIGGGISYILNCRIYGVEVAMPDYTVLEELHWWKDVP